MMKDMAIDARDERMLELLATGASNRDVAEQLDLVAGPVAWLAVDHAQGPEGVALGTLSVLGSTPRQNMSAVGECPP